MTKTPILRATAADWKATGIIGALCAIAVGGTIATANIHQADLRQVAVPGDTDAAVLADVPSSLTTAYSLPNQLVPGQYRAISAHGLSISHDGDALIATNGDGSTAWTYTRRDADLCSLSTAWGKVVATYHTGLGCGDTVAIDAATGEYDSTRSAVNSEKVVPVQSNDRVGTVSTGRIDLWRSDLVRTVEYGDVEAKQEAQKQPHEECTISSALTRTENLALTESCPDESHTTWLRFQATTPEDSREPEMDADVSLEGDGARLIAVGQDAAAVYVPGPKPHIESYNNQGEKLSSTPVKPSTALDSRTSPFSPAVADLPHHMTWFDGQRLYLLTPSDLRVDHVVDGAIGTPISVAGNMLMPTAQGIAVVNWSTGEVLREIDVDRSDYRGPVHLTLAGETIVETRGDTIVGLSSE
ncbi:hypothetical protein GWO53_09330 [Corynebacterium macginleyi]|uniref:Secreted protein n=1 Tax=Corynebacterium macginleyi TaxID=38290 RepID=A0ABS1Y8H8_9CORY|nr:hypothetical protein [Corynebacterium macginleyi]MBK4140634.1 hypothetical protein [Corynebacterium macginleyi]MBK4144887.1 hypothetical protein [Corynebacterium macginleyi]MBK4151287.1 hypothetical protein [Corynebacterium macginleyi]MBK4156095.1 hypothetical protein [Corynebacterium macginleyi]MBK4160860.1 hypothetical protein [Corynebacterium macginleyi]